MSRRPPLKKLPPATCLTTQCSFLTVVCAVNFDVCVLPGAPSESLSKVLDNGPFITKGLQVKVVTFPPAHTQLARSRETQKDDEKVKEECKKKQGQR